MARPHSLLCEHASGPLGIEISAPRLSWQSEGLVRQSAYRIQAASQLSFLEAEQPNLWDSGKVLSGSSHLVPYGGGALKSRQRVFWRVCVWNEKEEVSAFSSPVFWEMGLLQVTDWSAQWIGRSGVECTNPSSPVLPAPLLRKSFEVPANVKEARVYLCGLGYFELSLNGTRVGDHVLDPHVTQYEQHVGYLAFDVTALLQAGKNALGVMLGNGWYNCHTAEVWNFDKASWRDYPKLLLQLEMTLEDGSTKRVVSDSSWRWSEGPVRFDGLRNGETRDARALVAGWDGAAYEDAAWEQAMVVAGPGGSLFAQQAPPCRVTEILTAKSWWEIGAGVYVFDFGQNISGWGRLQTAGPSGTEIILRYAERLTTERDIETEHLGIFIKSGDLQTDRFVLGGAEDEVFEPAFTYHGFQYVRVEGLSGVPTAETLKACVVGSDFASVGSFTCSDEMVNRLQAATRWAYRGNFVGIPTDCPHREKNGWTGDAQLACETGLYNFDATSAYAHWLLSVADAQRPSGQLPGIVPTSGWGFNWGNGPAWDSALILIPWQIFLFRGDRRPLEIHYEAMKRYAEFAYALADGGLIRYGLGDWASPEGVTAPPRDLATTAILFDDCQILARIAGLLGKPDDQECFETMAAALRSAWRTAFLRKDGQVAGGEQSAFGAALSYDLLEPEERPAVVERLRAAVHATNGRPAFGILGAKWVPRVLADAGYIEEAYEMIAGKGYPGWVHWLEQGATTLWESWEGGASRNHIMFGDISAWMFRYLAGIRPLEEFPGFQRFVIAPQFVEKLHWVEAEHHSPYGLIRSAWRREPDAMRWEIHVPPNSQARLELPAAYRWVTVPPGFVEGGEALSAGQFILTCARG